MARRPHLSPSPRNRSRRLPPLAGSPERKLFYRNRLQPQGLGIDGPLGCRLCSAGRRRMVCRRRSCAHPLALRQYVAVHGCARFEAKRTGECPNGFSRERTPLTSSKSVGLGSAGAKCRAPAKQGVQPNSVVGRALVDESSPDNARPQWRRGCAAGVHSDTVSAIARTTGSEHLRIQAWTLLSGVKWPTASVFLHLAFPDEYPILDFRALSSLREDVPNQYDFAFWWNYTTFCWAIARKLGVSMRVLDQALWQQSKTYR